MLTTSSEWIQQYPILDSVANREAVFWCNPDYTVFKTAQSRLTLSEEDIFDAEQRLTRFAPYIAKVFPETQASEGIIESPLIDIPHIQQALSGNTNIRLGRLLLKCDNQLAISGSIKARGGIYEVLKHAETLALDQTSFTTDDDYSVLDSAIYKQLFSRYSIAVGSTGNLGLSIGIMSARLGFQATVHMSADAKQWKKDLLREKGVNVIEYQGDFSKAVEQGRQQAEQDANMHFVDDEQSIDLFMGYAVAAKRLQQQLQSLDVVVDANHPLFVYLPCGVGGGPGGITFGLKQVFKDNVHCFFAEPTASPCMMLGLMTGLHDKINVRDIGLDNVTDADGLAVASPSGLVGKTLYQMISGCYTVMDNHLFEYLSQMIDLEKILLEPSALASLPGAFRLIASKAGQQYIEQQQLGSSMANATHIVWATGGSMVPDDIMNSYYQKGRSLLAGDNQSIDGDS